MFCLRVSSSGAQSKAESEDAPQTSSEDNVVANGVQVGPWQWLGAGCWTHTYYHICTCTCAWYIIHEWSENHNSLCGKRLSGVDAKQSVIAQDVFQTIPGSMSCICTYMYIYCTCTVHIHVDLHVCSCILLGSQISSEYIHIHVHVHVHVCTIGKVTFMHVQCAWNFAAIILLISN